jgi:hypothetical protein
LINVNEKSFQTPFCQLLLSEGYTVVHLSRHGSFEEGKDILAIDPDGIPCAFQLKGSNGRKMSQNEWGKYVEQIVRLVEIPIDHPSIDKNLKRNVSFVLNGELEEEVRVEITKRNADWKSRKCPELDTILLGELIERFSKMYTEIWPIRLSSEKDLLELYLNDGRGYLDKNKFSDFFEKINSNNKKSKKIEIQRFLAGSSLYCSIALSPYERTHNHIALIEGWTIFLAFLISVVEENNLRKKYWTKTVEIIEESVIQSLENLYQEVIDRKYLTTGNVLVDGPFYRGRITWIISLLSTYYFLIKKANDENRIKEKFELFLLENFKYIFLWGEYAIPQLLSIVWVLYALGREYRSNQLIYLIFKGVQEKTTNNFGFAPPYHSLGEIILNEAMLSNSLKEFKVSGRSYSLKSLIHLLIKKEFRGVLAENWKQLSKIQLVEFIPKDSINFCRWHSEFGVLNESFPNSLQSWKELQSQANSINLEIIPKYFVGKPEFLLLFLIVFPHRINSDVVKFLQNSFE